MACYVYPAIFDPDEEAGGYCDLVACNTSSYMN